MKTSRLIMLLTSTLLLASATPVWAHAKPQHTSPQAGQTVVAPSELRIDFSETLEPAFSQLQLQSPEGKPVVLENTQVSGKTLRVALPHLSAGIYRVKWTAVARDGHRTQGQYSFSIK
jgi:methionine-rich copper-binding protein CopC